MEQPWQSGNYRFRLSVVMGAIRHNEEETLEDTISAIEYAVFQGEVRQMRDRSATVTGL